MASLDFTTFTFKDDNSRFTTTATKIVWASLPSTEDAYGYLDKTADYFAGNFVHHVTGKITAADTNGRAYIWVLANSIDDTKGIDDANGSYLAVFLFKEPTNYTIYLEECDSGAITQDSYVISLNTDYYLKIVRDETVTANGTLYCYVYTDSSRTTLVDTLLLQLNTSKKDFQYVYGVNNRNSGVGGRTISGQSENLDIDIAGTPTVTIQALTNLTETTATGNGNVTSLGAATPTAHGFAYGPDENPTITANSYTDEGAKGSTGAFTSSLTGLPRDARLHIRAYATNVFGTAYSADAVFYTDPSGIIQMAFDQSIFTAAPDWTDVTVDIMGLQTKRGRMHDLDRVEAGTAVIIAKNINGNWWRENTNGDYTPNMKPLTLIRISSVWNGTTYRLFYGLTESFKPGWIDRDGAQVPVMTITCVDLFKSLNKKKLQGLPGKVGEYEDVVAITNTGASGDAGQKTVQVKSLGDSATEGCDIKLFHAGQSLTIGDDNHTIDAGTAETNTIASIDEDTYILTMDTNLAASYTTANHAFVKKFPAALSSVRVTDVVHEMGWPIALTTIGTGVITIAELVPPTGGIPAIEHLQDVAEAETGLIFMNGDGYLIFQNQPYRIALALSATFGDDGVENKYYIPDLMDDDTMIFNEARISGDAIDEQVYRDATYQATQGERSLPRQDSLINTNADAMNQAYIIVERNKDSFMRCDNLIILPDADPSNLYSLVFGKEISTKIKLELQVSPNTAMLSRLYHIEAIEHIKNAGEAWQTKWQLWNANLFSIISSSYDGYLENIGIVSYANVHDAANGSSKDDELDYLLLGQQATATGWLIMRGYIEFDTSGIGSGNTIDSAELLVLLTTEAEGTYFTIDNTFDLTVVPATGVTSPIDLADYGDLLDDTTSYGSVEIATPAKNYQWISITLNSTGIAAINKTGTTRFGLRSSRDIDSSAPSASEKEFIAIKSYNSDFPVRLIVKLNTLT